MPDSRVRTGRLAMTIGITQAAPNLGAASSPR